MEEKLNGLQFKFSIPKKPVHISKFSVNRISRRSIIAAKTTYLPIIMSPGFEKAHNLIPDKSNRLMRLLAASCTTCN